MKVCIDPGHSGPCEPGAIFGGYCEYLIVLAIAEAAAVYLTKAGHQVLMTRTGNIQTDSLAFRTDMANANLCDVFVSIHANSYSTGQPCGIETFFFPDSVFGADLAMVLQKSLLALEYAADRGIKPANFYVLQYTRMPAALVEAGFLSNEADRKIITDPDWQRRIGCAIAQGILTYWTNLPPMARYREEPSRRPS